MQLFIGEHLCCLIQHEQVNNGGQPVCGLSGTQPPHPRTGPSMSLYCCVPCVGPATRARTTVPSSGLSGAQPPGRTHGCSSACTAVRRRDTSRSSRPCHHTELVLEMRQGLDGSSQHLQTVIRRRDTSQSIRHRAEGARALLKMPLSDRR